MKDYSLVLYALILGICILASSCGSSNETTAKAKCRIVGSSTVKIVNVDPLLSPGDTIVIDGRHRGVIVAMFFTYPKNPQD